MERSKYIYVPDFMVLLKEVETKKEITLSDIHLKTGITYSHLHRMKKDFIEKGWITEVKQGAKKILSITNVGIELVNSMTKFFGLLGVTKDNINSFRRRTKNKSKKEEKRFTQTEVFHDKLVIKDIEQPINDFLDEEEIKDVINDVAKGMIIEQPVKEEEDNNGRTNSTTQE
jgi:predicted transcriptional regulator